MKKLICYLITGHHWKTDGATKESVYHLCEHCGYIKITKLK